MAETFTSLSTGEKTTIEPYDLNGVGERLAPGQRIKVTIGDADPIILDRDMMERWIGYMKDWGG